MNFQMIESKENSKHSFSVFLANVPSNELLEVEVLEVLKSISKFFHKYSLDW